MRAQSPSKLEVWQHLLGGLSLDILLEVGAAWEGHLRTNLFRGGPFGAAPRGCPSKTGPAQMLGHWAGWGGAPLPAAAPLAGRCHC